ncbi:hypothetical protein [Flavobacterium kingsejongi]|uniref:Uncharacterized protein n=1 Tax=Flavobacterium kingsejongi TaxID=1678728 RepID=A0A2S1LKE8_9FLAO|nr:hypothetical protein [Flavobacterium kingsejongi]AWG24244.1 hypothetical protein FK004_02900 [Flavobacterium kingsejongi]
MADTTLKALAIKVHPNSEPQGVEFAWEKIKAIEGFTKNILIPALADDKEGSATVDIGSIVSGMPTAYARANLFRNALDSVTETTTEAVGFMRFYESLLDEWKGFISCIALNYKDLHIDRIHLAYSDGKKAIDTGNIYEPTGAFGNVLFERQPLWCDQSLADNSAKVPFIDIISFKGNVVGGTSPDSFLFTSVSYKIGDKLPFVNSNSGKFTNPLRSDLNPTDLFTIYGYAKHILRNINTFENHFSNLDVLLRPTYTNLGGAIQSWMNEMVRYQESKGYPKLENQAPPEVGTLFNYPFGILFNYSTELYGSEGTIATDANLEDSIAFDPKDLLLPDATEIAMIDFGKEGTETKNYLKSRPIILLEAETKGEPGTYAHFALPLTPLALNVFGKSLNALVGLDDTSAVKSRITAVYDPNDVEGEKVIVTLKLFTQNNNEPIIKQVVYKITRDAVIGQDLLLWPNFISKQWNRYFLYSEIPHNNNGKFQATPFVGDVNDKNFKIILDDKSAPVYLAEKGRTVDIPEKYGNIKAELHIASNNAVADNAYKYEIYESNQPFKGIKLAYAGAHCGFGIIRYSAINEAEMPRNLLADSFTLKEANLGVDFGSTNTSIAYYSQHEGRMKPDMKLKNRRISLFASDKKNNDVRPAVEDEIFFFQNDEIRTNAIKSILTIHDPKRIVKDSDIQTMESAIAMAIKGGFPNFEKNLPIESATENRYRLSYPRVGSAELVHNMKWSTDELENSYKKAYLSSLLLHVYAQLFEEGHVPVNLKWSYPSSMSSYLVGQYQNIWDDLPAINPIVGGKPLSVSKSPANTRISSEPVFDTATQNTWGIAAPVAKTPAWGETPSEAAQNTAPAAGAGWGAPVEKKTKFKEIKVDNGPVTFNFQKLSDNKALTEACAVANYLANNQSLNKSDSYLTLCFDVGGSTTDISAMCMMMGDEGPSLALVKQSSIRFAAQRISFATRYSPNFKNVLLEICQRKKISIQGLNVQPDRYTSETAPYYFEQIVDRLEEEDFPAFYQLLRAKCPEMMSINLYVTGLIMYYAGQIAYKLRNEIVNSPDKHPAHEDWKPIINIVFAGKGARIFDWFPAVDQQLANNYFTELFIKGFGGMEKAKANLFPGGHNGGPPIIINPTNTADSSNVKYEVAKGLAYPTQSLLVPQTNDAIEILGEEGFTMLTAEGQKKEIAYDASISSEMMEGLGTYFNSTPVPGKISCPKFAEFAGTYFQVATDMFGLKMTQQDFMNGFQNMNMNAYIKSLPEYRLASESTKSEKFDFIAPIIILEGMKFLEEYLLESIKKQ